MDIPWQSDFIISHVKSLQYQNILPIQESLGIIKKREACERHGSQTLTTATIFWGGNDERQPKR